jgi:hypothetical protein
MSDVEVIVVDAGPLEGAWVRTAQGMVEIVWWWGVNAKLSSDKYKPHFAGRELRVAPSEKHWHKCVFLVAAGLAQRFDVPVYPNPRAAARPTQNIHTPRSNSL